LSDYLADTPGISGLYGLATLIVAFGPAYYITQLEYKLYEQRLEVKDEKISLMQEAIQAISMIKMMAAERFWFRRIKTVRDREFKRMIQARMLGFISGLL
jgi:ABC-type bacteriocin/lantibiotic exporter with double-glycine peptidase domain